MFLRFMLALIFMLIAYANASHSMADTFSLSPLAWASDPLQDKKDWRDLKATTKASKIFFEEHLASSETRTRFLFEHKMDVGLGPNEVFKRLLSNSTRKSKGLIKRFLELGIDPNTNFILGSGIKSQPLICLLFQNENNSTPTLLNFMDHKARLIWKESDGRASRIRLPSWICSDEPWRTHAHRAAFSHPHAFAACAGIEEELLKLKAQVTTLFLIQKKRSIFNKDVCRIIGDTVLATNLLTRKKHHFTCAAIAKQRIDRDKHGGKYIIKIEDQSSTQEIIAAMRALYEEDFDSHCKRLGFLPDWSTKS